MDIDFCQNDNWAKSNQEFLKSVGCDDDRISVGLHRGLSAALMETSIGLAKQFPFKKKVYYIKGIDPFFDKPMAWLAKDGFNLSPLKKEVLFKGVDSLKEELGEELLSKEVLFFLYPEDVSMIGQSFPVESLRKDLDESGITQVRVSHLRHRELGVESKLSLLSKEILITSMAADLSISLHGERAKVGPVFSELLTWTEEDLKRAQEQFTSIIKADKNQAEILSFESKKLAGACPHFDAGALRTYQSAVVYWKDMDGYAFIEELSSLLSLKLEPPGKETRLETTSLSRWGGAKTMGWLETLGLEPHQIRGLVLISPELISQNSGDNKFEEAFVKARQNILKLQG